MPCLIVAFLGVTNDFLEFSVCSITFVQRNWHVDIILLSDKRQMIKNVYFFTQILKKVDVYITDVYGNDTEWIALEEFKQTHLA